MKVLVVGGGGREHALCWAIASSPLVDALWCAPGNAGIARDAECVPVAAENISGLLEFARETAVDLVVIGPEAPLIAGLADRLQAFGIRAFGPGADAALLEGSKSFMKDLCARHGIPTASYRRFTDAAAAKSFVAESGTPIVVKADGPAGGKGVVVCETVEQAYASVDDMLTRGVYGAAGAEIVIEEFLEGEEASFFALVDGEHVLPLATAQDYKRICDGDTGPNTGGMGALSPAPAVTEEVSETVMNTIVAPTVEAMKAEGRPYKGVLYAGLMLTADGPKLLEYNARLGDPECQVLMARLMSDIVPALVATCDGELGEFDLRWYDETALTVVMAARGYPGPHDRGSVIRGLDAAAAMDDITVFHAGTGVGERGEVVSAGGRVLNVTALGKTVSEARGRAYEAVDLIDWPEGFCRRDIGVGFA